LLGILRGLTPPPSPRREAVMMGVTERAFHGLVAARKETEADGGEAQFRTLLESAKKMSAAWAAASTSELVKRAINDVARRTAVSDAVGPIQNTDAYWSLCGRIARQLSGLDVHASLDKRIKQDLELIIGLMELFMGTLSGARKIRNAADYQFAGILATGWLGATGVFPTMTRNTDATSGFKPLPFQQFVEAAAPRPKIGQGIIRAAIEEIKRRDGDRKPAQNGAENPQKK
jgi:hypothetical protein